MLNNLDTSHQLKGIQSTRQKFIFLLLSIQPDEVFGFDFDFRVYFHQLEGRTIGQTHKRT